MLYHVKVGERVMRVEPSREGVLLEGVAVPVDLAPVEGTNLRSLLLGGASFRILAYGKGGGRWSLHVRGRRYEAEVVDERTRAIRDMTGADSAHQGPRPVRAPMPGLVVKVEVEVGDRVEPGQGVAIVEAMKMENELRAEAAGVVSRIHVARGQTVDKDQILIELEAPGGPGEGS